MGNFQSVKSNPGKKFGILFCLNELFWIYFKLVNYHQCKSNIRIVETNLKNDIPLFPKSEQVAYYYYSGRMALFESSKKKAYFELDKAFHLSWFYYYNKFLLKKYLKNSYLKFKILLNFH